jgi:outer membrane lipoprotein-sorting protein
MIRAGFLFLGLAFILSFSYALSRDALASQHIAQENDTKSQVFAQISSVSRNLQAISSDFIQERHLAVLKDPLLSSGRFGYKKPDSLCWEIIKPVPSGFEVTSGKARRWMNDQKHSQSFDLEKEPVIKAIVEQIFAWTRADFPWLEKRYAVTVSGETPTELRLAPLSSQERKHISHLIVRFSENWSQLNSVEIHEKSGDFTRIIFVNTIMSQPSSKLFSE